MGRDSISLRRVGFWRQVESGRFHDSRDDDLPDPRLLVDVTWGADVKNRVVGYLRRGWLTNYAYMGHSYCRFHCGIQDDLMGCRDYTDGVWLWPQGLSHYVEAHSVRLPREFLDHLELVGYEYPNQVTHNSFTTQEDEERMWKSSELYHRIMAETIKPDT